MVSSTGTGSYLGREEQLDRLLRRLHDAAEGRGGRVVVAASPGMGVSTTLEEIGAHAAQQGFAVLRGQFVEGVGGRPFGAFADGIDGLADSSDPFALYADLGDAAPALARLAPALRRALPAIPPPAPLEPPDETLRLWEGCRSWLSRASARQPVLIALDDAQWADADTLALLDHLVREPANLPVLLVFGTSTVARAAHGLAGSAEFIELPGLDDGAIGALLARESVDHVPRRVSELVQAATGGHPLAASQLYRHLVEEQLVGRPGGSDVPSADSLPKDLADIVAWRLARLSADERGVLGVLVCFPRAVGTAAVSSVSGLSRARAANALERLAGTGFVSSTEGSGRYRVEPAALASAISNGLAPKIRSEALLRAAEALELELGTDARRHAPMLLELYRRAANDRDTAAVSGPRAASAARFGLIAAEQARSAAAFRRAADCLAVTHELAVLGEQPGQNELHVRLAQAQAEAGRPSDALASATMVLDQLADERPDGPTIETLLATVDALTGTRAEAEARQLAEEVSRRLRPDRALEARLALRRGSWQPYEAGSVRALVWHEAQDRLDEVILERGTEADASRLLAPQRPRSHQQTVTLLAAARGWRQPSALLRALAGATFDLTTRLGLFREAASWAGEYVAAAERYGAPRDHVRALLLLAQCRAASGDLDGSAEAVATGAEALARLPPDEDLAVELLLAELVLAFHREGPWAGLAERAAGALEGLTPAGLLLAAEASVAFARDDDTGRAEPLVADVLRACADWPPLTHLRDSALMSALSTVWDCGWAQHAVAGRALARSAQAAGAGGNHTSTPVLALARMHALAGELAEAHDHFAAERAALAGAGRRPLRAIVDYDEAIALAAAGPARHAEASQLLELAARAFEELGMVGWEQRARRLLGDGLEAAAQPGGRLHFTYPRGLSRREADVIRLVSSGSSLEDAAAALELDPATARRHLDEALGKLETSPEELPRLARRLGLGGI
ncbi:MAG TPA: AAA family ATPase [Candidatus Limnocylindrales bacterium]|nr:AAA family ATPase [Candidatus Limnocylindrales bacterium]